MARAAAAQTVVAAMVAAMLLSAPFAANAAITCDQVNSALGACTNYIRGGVNEQPPGCCRDVRTLLTSGTNIVDRRTMCSCVRTLGKDRENNSVRLLGLPQRCGISRSPLFGVC